MTIITEKEALGGYYTYLERQPFGISRKIRLYKLAVDSLEMLNDYAVGLKVGDWYEAKDYVGQPIIYEVVGINLNIETHNGGYDPRYKFAAPMIMYRRYVARTDTLDYMRYPIHKFLCFSPTNDPRNLREKV